LSRDELERLEQKVKAGSQSKQKRNEEKLDDISDEDDELLRQDDIRSENADRSQQKERQASRPVVSEQEFSKKFRNTFSEARQEPSTPTPMSSAVAGCQKALQISLGPQRPSSATPVVEEQQQKPQKA